MDDILSRTKIHENGFLCIFQFLFYEQAKDLSYKKPIEEIVSDIMGVSFDDCDAFFKAIIFETIKNRKEYIELINTKLNRWTFSRLNLTDQAILLLFSSELINKRAPIQVCIDVAVDLAHRYCDDKSFKYINKVLDRIGKENA
ncbi:MAG: transcription antitermination protein NusB [Erysipelotrichaceae bacterium]|nr:transcription antitermination protein NusB [Erysipelotrichaceae bacterium]